MGRSKPKTSDEFIHNLCKTGVLKGGHGSSELSYSMIRAAHDMQRQVTTPAERAALALFMRNAADSLEHGRGFLLFRGQLDCPFPMTSADRAGMSIATDGETCSRVAKRLTCDLMAQGWSREIVAAGLLDALETLKTPGTGSTKAA